jgi:16S rRNA processing protein RimM
LPTSPNLVFLGKLGRTHGVAGEIYVDRTSLTTEEWLAVGPLEWRGRGGEARRLELRAMRPTHDRLLATFTGIRDREAAAELTNGELWGDAAKLPDPGPGVAYTFQLVGLRVVDTHGAELGVVRDISQMAAQPLYIIEQAGRERLVPACEPFVKKVDLAAGVITVDLPPGFEEL